MDTPIRGFPRGDVRLSDAERDRAVAELSEHYQAGRLTAGEFEERSSRALQARKGAELSGLFTDLPEPAASAARPASTQGARSWPSLRPARIAFLCVIALIVIGGVLASLRTGHHVGFDLPIPVVVLVIIIRRRLSGRR